MYKISRYLCNITGGFGCLPLLLLFELVYICHPWLLIVGLYPRWRRWTLVCIEHWASPWRIKRGWIVVTVLGAGGTVGALKRIEIKYKKCKWNVKKMLNVLKLVMKKTGKVWDTLIQHFINILKAGKFFYLAPEWTLQDCY